LSLLRFFKDQSKIEIVTDMNESAVRAKMRPGDKARVNQGNEKGDFYLGTWERCVET
jgi:hypothetical protein